MSQEKTTYKKAMRELRKLLDGEKHPLLSQIEKYMGELRRKSTSITLRNEELVRIVATKEREIADLKPLTLLEAKLSQTEREKANILRKNHELQSALNEWQEIEEDKSTFVKVKVKCLRCSLHFVICTEHPETHTTKTIRCPECGSHHGQFMVWKEVPEEAHIFQAVPGDGYALTEFGPPNQE